MGRNFRESNFTLVSIVFYYLNKTGRSVYSDQTRASIAIDEIYLMPGFLSNAD